MCDRLNVGDRSRCVLREEDRSELRAEENPRTAFEDGDSDNNKYHSPQNKVLTMHSLLVRGQNVFGYFTTVASAVAALIAVSVLLIPQAPSASLKLRNVQVYVNKIVLYLFYTNPFVVLKEDRITTAQREKNTPMSASIWTQVQLYHFCHDNTQTNINRSLLAIQLEHKTSLRLHNRNVSLQKCH